MYDTEYYHTVKWNTTKGRGTLKSPFLNLYNFYVVLYFYFKIKLLIDYFDIFFIEKCIILFTLRF